MRSAFNLILFSFLGLSLSFCGTFSKSDNKDQASNDQPKYENYHSSGVYSDIEGEGRTPSSEEYSDDEYGEVDTGEVAAEKSESLISDSDQESESENDPLPIAQEDPLPVEKLQKTKLPPKVKAKKKVASVSSSFKNGMHSVVSNCAMRAKASDKSKDVGSVNKGKKLWMENHNENWVKIFKKSGPVYLSKDCL